MIPQIWLQQFCCTIKTEHTNAKYTEGLFHPGMMHRDTFNNCQKCILITHTDRREHNSCSCCQERGCAAATPPELHRNCAKIRCGTTTAGNSGHDSPFPRILGWRLYYGLPISLEFKQKAKDKTSQGYSLVLHCFLHWFVMVRDSVALCTQLVQNPKKLKWCDETNSFNNRKSTAPWPKSPNTTVSKASLIMAELSFIEELDEEKIQ